MAIDVNNINISLNQFDAVSSGKYNIGQLKFNADGTGVYRTNNHKTWTIFNNTKISMAESIAMRHAFCNALAKEGLSAADMDSIRSQLNIGKTRAETWMRGNVKPLSAEEVRTIIDEYGAKINTNRREQASKAGLSEVSLVSNSQDLFKGVSMADMNARETTRKAVNAQTLETITTRGDIAVNHFLDIVNSAPDGETLAPGTKELAKEIVKLLGSDENALNVSQGLKSAPVTLSVNDSSGKVRATFMFDGGHSLAMDTDITPKELLKKAQSLVNAAAPQKSEDVKGEGKVKVRATEAKVETNAKPKVSAEIKQLVRNVKNAIAATGIKRAKMLAGKSTETEVATPLNKTQREELKRANPEAFRRLAMSMKNTNDWRNYRDGMMKKYLNPIITALQTARPFDPDNAELVNRIRDFFYGGTNVTYHGKTMTQDELLGELERVLSAPSQKANTAQANDDINENLRLDAFQ